jgi:carboxyl-terminal processing protease
MGRLSTFFIVNLLIFGSVEAASNNAYKLGKSNIRPSMEEMLNYHVEFKEFSPLLVKRSFKLFLEQFDPYKVYVLQKEATPFLNMNEKDAFAVVEAYYKDDYPKYEALNELIRRSIFRARDLREKIAKDLIENFEGNQSPSVDLNVSYAKDAQDLSSRIKSQMQYILMIEKKQEQLETWTAEDKEKILTLWEKRFRRMEETYLANDTQHNLALHILKSMAKSLDAHTSFFSPEEAFELRTSLEKQFEGVGVVLREGINGVVVKEAVKFR